MMYRESGRIQKDSQRRQKNAKGIGKRLLACLLSLVLIWPALPAKAAETVATVTLCYSLGTNTGSPIEKTFKTENFTSLAQAFSFATEVHEFKEQITGESLVGFQYEAPILKLLQDAEVADTIQLGDSAMRLDLNTHSLTVKESGMIRGNAVITVKSANPGVLISSGTINAPLVTTTTDTINIKSGLVSSLAICGGNVTLSGGRSYLSETGICNGTIADTKVYITDAAELYNSHIRINSDPEAGYRSLSVVIDKTARIADLQLLVKGPLDKVIGKPNMIINGGYYTGNPSDCLAAYTQVAYDAQNVDSYYVYDEESESYTMYGDLEDEEKALYNENSTYYVFKSDAYRDCVLFNAPAERYVGQSDWKADPSAYLWRVDENAGPEVPVQSVTVNKKELTMKIGESILLTASVLPENATNRAITWESSDDEVANVVEGRVTAVAEGEVLIRARAGGKTGYCEVTVLTADGKLPSDPDEEGGGNGKAKEWGSDEDDNSFMDPITGAEFRILSADPKHPTCAFIAADLKSKTVQVPASVKDGDTTYKVTAISDQAFKNCTNLKKVVIPASVKKLGANLFTGCKKLRLVIVQTKKLKRKTVHKKAFADLNKKAKVRVPVKKKKAYTGLFRKCGLSKKVKIK